MVHIKIKINPKIPPVTPKISIKVLQNWTDILEVSFKNLRYNIYGRTNPKITDVMQPNNDITILNW
jgi:hypothetical protein